MIVERARIAALVREDETLVALDLAGAREVERTPRGFEAAPAGQAAQLAVEREHPAVVTALEGAPAGAAVLPAEHRAAMRTAVGQHLDRAVARPHHDDGLAPELARDPVARVRHLRLVPDEHPAAPEDAIDLVLEDLRIGIEAAMHPPVLDQPAVVHLACVCWRQHRGFLPESQSLPQ